MQLDEFINILRLCHFDTCNATHMIFGHNIGKGLFVKIECEFSPGNYPPECYKLKKLIFISYAALSEQIIPGFLEGGS